MKSLRHLMQSYLRSKIVRLFVSLALFIWTSYALFMSAIILFPLSAERITTNYPESRRIFDRQGRLLREVVNADGARAQWAELEGISPFVIAATLAIEDADFYGHSGINWRSVARAAWQNVSNGRRISGASTITMQLARLLFGYPRKLSGKLWQAFDALRLERAIAKDAILEQYLNRAFYGAGAIGIEAASQRYFGKPNAHLSLAEAALLSGLPKAPSDLNPLRNPQGALKRQRLVLWRMLQIGKIAQEEYRRACREPLVFRKDTDTIFAMHFTDCVIAQNPPAGDVFTTLDGDLQRQIERLVSDHVRSFASGGLTNAAAVVLDNATGAIAAMVGSADYRNPNGGNVNGATALRQPGSALKPFTYALAFEQGFTPASVVPDVPTHYLASDGSLFVPRNYSERFYGPVMMREALGRSLNVPAIRTANAVGIEALLARLRAAGFHSLTESAEHYGLGLTLGNGEVTLLELAQGYAMFARGGLTCQATPFANAPKHAPQRVFSPEIAFLITDILSDENLRIRAFGAANPLLLGFPMAIKTGTSANWRDNWVVGYTPDYTIAVWAGDFEGNPMHQMSGAIGAGPLFHKIAQLVAFQGATPRLPERPEPPEGVRQIMICPVSGMLATENCPHKQAVFVLKDSTPLQPCSTHQKQRIDRRNGLLASVRCPSEFVTKRVAEILPPEYAEWQESQGMPAPPTRYSPFCPEHGQIADALVITMPRNGDVFLLEPGYDEQTQTVELSGEANPALPQVAWLVDGEEVAAAGWPYQADWQMTKGVHTLEMSSGGRRSEAVKFEVR